MSTYKMVQNNYCATTDAQLAAYQNATYTRMHEQVAHIQGYKTWLPIGDDRDTLDMSSIFTRGGVYRDWELGLTGYAATYISAPATLG